MVWMGSKANIAAIVALSVADLEDGIAFWALAEKQWLGLDKTSTATANSKSCWNATGGGRWFVDSTATVIATTLPTGAAATGTRWVYQEGIETYDSVVSYYYNGTAWVELDARMRVHTDTPASLSKTPNSDREMWLDTTTGILYHAFSGGWVAGGAVS